MLARDVMTAPVISVGPSASLRSAVGTMIGKRLSGLPVVDDAGRLVGIVSEGDLLRRAELGTERKVSGWLAFLRGPGPAAADYVRSHSRLVGDIMTPDPIAIDEETTLDEIVELMEKRRVKRLPVLRAGELVGIVSRADLLRALVPAETSAAETVTRDDGEIAAAIRAEVDAQKWAPRDTIRIGVVHGRVTLAGTILDERERAALLVCAENQPGVVAVVDELVFVDPASGAYMGPPGAIA